MEFSTGCDKVSQALATLKLELMSIREQDVDLMKQLLKISDTIKVLKPKPSGRRASLVSNGCQRVTSTSTSHPNCLKEHLSKRRGSFGSSNGSLSSVEEFTSSTENSTRPSLYENDEVFGSEDAVPCSESEPLGPGCLNSKFSRSCSDEHLLISNIKVWKYKQSRSSEELRKISHSSHVS